MIRSVSVALILGSAACAGVGDSDAGVVETDSAGIVIFTHSDLSAPTWRLDTVPTVQLGTVDGGGPELFFRVSAARRLAGGEIAVMDGSREIRIFAHDGSFLRTFGREGDGPGEYRGPGRMFPLPPDSLAIFDTRLRRLTILDDHGVVGRVISPQGIGVRPQILTVLPDGSTLFEEEILLGYTPTEYTQQFSNFRLYGPDGALVDSLPPQPRVEVAIWGEGPLAGPRLLDEGTELAGDPQGYWVGTTKSPEIRRYSLAGQLERIVRWADQDRRVQDADVELAIQEALDALAPGADRERMTALFRSRGSAELFPSHALLLVDNLGFLWVQEFERPGHVGPTTWRVFGPEGRLAARVDMPAAYRVFDIGETYVLARGLNENGVEYIRLFDLDRTGAE